MPNNTTHLVLFVVAISGCTAGVRPAPVRTSPTLEAFSLPGTVGLRDRLRSDLVGYDAELDRVVVYENGTRRVVQDRAVNAQLNVDPTALRVFPDGSMAITEGPNSVVVFPVSGTPQRLSFEDDMGAIDGASINDFWIVRPSIVRDTIIARQVCHWVNLSDSGCVEVAASITGGYDEVFAVADDGSFYINNRDRKLFRVADGVIVEVPMGDRLVSRIRHAGTRLLAIANDNNAPGVFELRGLTVSPITGSYVTDAVGSDTATFFSVFDSESVRTDPNCRSGWFGETCPTTTVWSEYVIYQHQNGQLREIAHQSCVGEARCNLIEFLAVDGASVVALGAIAQRVPSSSP